MMSELGTKRSECQRMNAFGTHYTAKEIFQGNKKLHGFSSCYRNGFFRRSSFALIQCCIRLALSLYVCAVDVDVCCAIAKVVHKNGDTFACDDFNGRIIDSVYL